MRHTFGRLVFFLMAAVIGVSAAVAQELPHANPIVRSSNTLATELYIAFAEDDKNFVFSPSSIYTALAMLYGGARGSTAGQIREVLGFADEMTSDQFHASLLDLQAKIGGRANKGDVELGVANAIWPQAAYPVLDSFLALMADFNAEIKTLNYSSDADGAQEIINTWASERTGGRITNLLEDPPYPTTLLVLANAIFFSGAWNAQFDPANTMMEPFFGEDGTTTDVPLMHMEQNLTYREFDTVEVLELPYDKFQLSMVVVLPTGENTLAEVEAGLSAASLKEWTTHYWRAIVDVSLPKFALKSRFDIKPVLSDMGMGDVFVNGLADLSGIDGNPFLLSLGFMLQKAAIDVHEEGAEAAAVTVGGGCFPAGTPVLTSAGAVPIEKVGVGSTLPAFDQSIQKWVNDRVVGLETIMYSGDVVTFQAGGTSITATGNHPIFVTAGAGLDSRPDAGDVPIGERRATLAGRWIEARDLRKGDVLKAKSGGDVTVSKVSSRSEKVEVYNLQVERYHNYAVGIPGVLVHNKGSGEPVYAEFRANRPFLFFIQDMETGGVLFMGRVGSLPHEN